MHIDRYDFHPPTLLDARFFSREMMAGGAFAAVAAHIVLPIVIVLVTSALAAIAGKKPQQTFNEMHVVEAKFVRLGKTPDPKKLPDRIVPRKQTAPDQQVVVSKNMNPDKPDKPDAGPRPEHPVNDVLTRLGDRAQAFAEIQEEKEREGDPNGDPQGTETQAQVGDIYLGKIAALFKKGWTIPSTLGDTSRLQVGTTFEITSDLRIGAFEIVQSSGEPLFDQSAMDRFQQMRDQNTRLPPPPPEVANQFIGQTVGVRFHGKGAN
jgi:outer membrane biosynthesis protein TonB